MDKQAISQWLDGDRPLLPDNIKVIIGGLMEENERRFQEVLRYDRDMKYLRDRNAELEKVMIPEMEEKDTVLNLIAETEWNPNIDLIYVQIPFEMRMMARAVLSKYNDTAYDERSDVIKSSIDFKRRSWKGDASGG